MNKKTQKEIGKRIRKARRDLDYSQAALGQMLGVSDKTVAAWEKGTNEVGSATLTEIAKYLKRPVSYFYSDPNSGAQSSLEKAA